MFWNSKWFPGTNLQDLNLDWILKKIAALRGGTANQILYKKSDKDFDFGWTDESGGAGAVTREEFETLENTVNEINANVTTLETKNNLNNISLEFGAVGVNTYADVFNTYNELSALYLDSGTFAPMIVISGAPTIVEQTNDISQGHNSLKCFGTTSQQIANPSNIAFFNLINGHVYYVAFCINVERYVSGWCGILFTGDNALPNMFYRNTTNGWVLTSQVAEYTGETGRRRIFIGTGDSANADCYIASPVVIDLTALGLNDPLTKQSVMDVIYKNYLTLTDSIEFRNRKLTEQKPIIAATVLNANSETDRFLAAKQLFDLARKKLINPYYVPKDFEYTVAQCGSVCKLPAYNGGMFENYSFNFLANFNDTVTAQPASVAKVMNAITALRYVQDVNTQYTIESGDVLAGSGSAYAAGDILTVRDLLHAMFLESSNTAANALGTMCGRLIRHNQSLSNTQARQSFINQMNTLATEIGCTNTYWQRASGYNAPNSRTTTADMMQILFDACSFPEILRIWNKKTYIVHVGGDNARDITITTTVEDTNLENYYYIFGGKTGHADNANALVIIAEPK